MSHRGWIFKIRGDSSLASSRFTAGAFPMCPHVEEGVRGSLGSPTSQGVGAHHGEDRAIRSNRPERHRQPRKDLKKQDTEQKEK